jgi:phage shock protein A
MSIFDRIGRLFKSNVNDMIDKAEDPEKMLKQIIEELNQNLLQVKQQVASAIATEKTLYTRYQQFQSEAEKWQRNAELAVDKGDDDLAREALQRKATTQQTADGFRGQWEEQKKSVAVLKDSLNKLESKISEAQTKKDLLIARHRRANAEERIQKTLTAAGSNSAMGAFERMEAKVLEKESSTAAYGELAGDSLENRFAALGSGEPAVEDALAQLKAKKSAPMLPPGSES